MSWLRSDILENENLRLEPVNDSHWEALARSATLETFAFYTSYPASFDAEGFKTWIETRTAEPHLTYAMIQKSNSEVVGCSCMFDASEFNKKLEIGYSWIAKELRGTWVNPTAKYLMLRQCFETLGCTRVQLKTDNRNEQSKAAILKMGGTFEGVLRKTYQMPDGFVRDTAYFSVLKDEWPTVKANLESRINKS